MDKGEIIIYKTPDNTDFQLEVMVESDTVWLNRQQIAILFDRDIKTIGKHISKALREELSSVSVVANFATTASDGKVYQVAYYNLDMIISVGYRVKSERGIQFRIWANKVIKEYLLKGYAVNSRIERIENEVGSLKGRMNEFEFHIKTRLTPSEGIFYDGQFFDAHKFVSDLIRSAGESIILIDNYLDDSVLFLLSKRKDLVKVTIYTSGFSQQFKQDLEKYNSQYPPIEVRTFKRSRDRFLIIDELTVYHIGASLKDMGKKWFAFSKINIDASDLVSRLEEKY